MGDLEIFAAGANIDEQALVARGLVKGRFDRIKILGDGELTKAVTVSAHAFSKTAAEKIQKAGGKVVLRRRARSSRAAQAVMSAISAFANIGKVPELRRRILFTVVLLAVYRIGVFVTIPGVDRTVMNAVMHKQGGGLLGLFNMFSGGALGNLSIFALGIMPYVSASIILQLLTMVFKPLDELRKEGEQGQRKINQYTRYGTIVLSLVQGFGIAMSLEAMNNGDLSDPAAVGDVVTHAGWGFRSMSMLTLTTGTAFMMWVGEQITERGIGNGISLLIFAGIVDGIPDGVASYFATNKGNIQPLNLAAVVAIVLATVATIVFFERAQRRIPIYYARRTVGRRVYGGQTAHLPLRVNTSGTIPPIFASSLAHVSGDPRELQGPRDVAAPVDAPARRLGVQHVLRVAHHLLLPLLHGGHLPAGRRGRQPEEAAGVHPERSSGQADGRLHRLRAHAHHLRRVALRRRRVHRAEHHQPAVPRALPLGRHLHHDRRRCRTRHRRTRSKLT